MTTERRAGYLYSIDHYIGLIATAILWVLAPVGFETYRRYRNPKGVVCPHNHKLAEVGLNGWLAGLVSVQSLRPIVAWLTTEETEPAVRQGLLWPEFHDRDQSRLRLKALRLFHRSSATHGR